MKKLTPRHKEWHRRRALREARHERQRIPGIMSARRADAYENYKKTLASLPDACLIYDERPGCCVLKPPANLDLVENYGETLAFLMEVRGRNLGRPTLHPETGARLRLFTDFTALARIAPGAGLVLAAELDRRRLVTGVKPRSLDAEWNPEVRSYFADAGLFDLLGIDQQSPPGETLPSSLHAVRFVRGRSVRGQIGAALRDQIETLCGKKIGPRLTVYEAISEAIANTRHAYPTDAAIWPTKAKGQWWAAGTWNSSTDVVSIQLYDQGVGIPATLPRSEHWSSVIKLAGLGDRLHPERRDDRLIAAALEVGRTSTGETGRGKGLAEMAAWIDKLGNGFLRITSGRGSITYRPGGEVEGTSQRAPFFGTLIEWEIGLGG
jgi:hypothetical protein